MEQKMKKKRRKSETNLNGFETAAVYRQDLGSKGIKNHHAGTTMSRCSGSDSSCRPSTNDFDIQLTKAEKRKRKERENRFSCNSTSSASSTNKTSCLLNQSLSSSRVSSAIAEEPFTLSSLVGRNQSIEKSYLRLTDFPNPQDVRPLNILVKSLAHIKQHYIQTEDFEYANDQLKSVRQDLTVQNIRNLFVLDVYETHARILLEHGDLDEFNKCQSMIQSLTSGRFELTEPLEIGRDGLTNATSHAFAINRGARSLHQSPEAADEFTAYSILYAIVRNSCLELRLFLMQATQFTNDANDPVSKPSCEHAINVLLAVAMSNYSSFFQLYQSAPHMSAYLMDFMLQRVRDAAMRRILVAYRPKVSVQQVQVWLGFHDIAETRLYLQHFGEASIDETRDSH
ncbi:hypothetical protein MPSEU_001057300 [Mayamaea pseudoterrestris]|nr:hypothetical protein MPSEU_001057300 [Mayamaea pseudoterrestris]